MTYYDTLGVSSTATDADIKKAYHQIIIAFHPDKYQGDIQYATKKTNEIIEAYGVLGNPATRKIYDDSLNSQNTTTSALKRKSHKNKDQKGNNENRYNAIKVMSIVIGIIIIIIVLLLIFKFINNFFGFI